MVELEDSRNKRLRSGLKTDVHILYAVRDDIMRIKNGVYYMGKGDYELFVSNSDNEIVKRKVKLGESNYEYVEVEEGLKPGDKVVVSDMNNFKNKKRIKLKN